MDIFLINLEKRAKYYIVFLKIAKDNFFPKVSLHTCIYPNQNHVLKYMSIVTER